MTTGPANQSLEKIREFIGQNFSGRYEIYDLTFKPVNKRNVLEVIIDAPQGITVKDCETVSRSLGKFLDDNDLIHSAYTLDVSSPGAERLLKRQVDFERNLGRMVRWALKIEGGQGRDVFHARLHEFSAERIVVQGDDGLREFPLGMVDEARVVLEFPRKQRG